MMGQFPLNLSARVILVEATLIGTKRSISMRLILDTGASFTMISPELLAEAGYDPTSTTDKRAITTASGTEYCPFIKVKALTAFDHTMKGIEICSHSLPPNLPVRGLLGLNFLRHFNLHLRFLDKILEISK